jgi:hypothetical protein
VSTRQLFTEIAKKHLRIETLETRNSDSLDFHDVSVWGVEAALQEAYLAGKNGKKNMPKDRAIGTGFKAAVETTYQNLVDIFGEPQKGDGYKTEAQWRVLLPKDKILTIYNYKNSQCYSDKYPPVTEVKEWHVGGHGNDIVDIFLRMMYGRAKLVE